MNSTTAHENGDENNNTMQYEEPKMSIQPITINKHHIRFNLTLIRILLAALPH